MEWSQLHGAIESLLFAAGDPISKERLCRVLGEESSEVEAVLEDLRNEYQFRQRGLRLIQLGDCYQMTSAPEYAPMIRDMMEKRKPDRLSPAALEVMSILAYYQPVTRAYIEQVRGVDSSYTLGLLLDRDLVEECGRLEVPGRPILYRTTQTFLRSFGLNSLEDLPELPVSESFETPEAVASHPRETEGG